MNVFLKAWIVLGSYLNTVGDLLFLLETVYNPNQPVTKCI